MTYEMRIDIVKADAPGWFWVVPDGDSEASLGCQADEIGDTIQELFDDRNPS